MYFLHRLLTSLLLIIIIAFKATAADSTYEQKLMRRIYQAQSVGTKDFAKGLFPSYREYYFNRGTIKNDDNSFFTAIILYTLQQVEGEMSDSSKTILASLRRNASTVYTRFQNKKGKPVYCFWMTKPKKKYFPNTAWLSFFQFSALPDDLDCSAMVQLAQKSSLATVNEMHQYIQAFQNGKNKRNLSTFKEYRTLAAYSTWLGHKVPVDFDVCALANVLLLVNQYQLPYTHADSASLKLIVETIRRRRHQTAPQIVSPYYARTPIILYHISRLMASRSMPELELYKQQLISDANEEYRRTDNYLDKIILSTSLLRWGVVTESLVDKEGERDHLMANQSFVFFVANMAGMLPNPFMRFMTRSNLGRFDYYCPVYNDALLLENLLLQKRFTSR